jgi:hypothetical protein
MSVGQILRTEDLTTHDNLLLGSKFFNETDSFIFNEPP